MSEIEIIQPTDIINISYGEIVSDAASEINREHELCIIGMRSGIEHGFRCGELLTEQKQNTPHGEWELWVRTNCNFNCQ